MCCVFLHLMLPVSLDCPYVIAPSVFSNIYLIFCEKKKENSDSKRLIKCRSCNWYPVIDYVTMCNMSMLLVNLICVQ